MILSKVISTAIEKGRLIVKILGLGSSDVKTVYNLSQYGIDSNVTKNYRGIYSDTLDNGEKVLIGVILKNAIADIGETRLFSEDSEGNEVFSVYLKNDGTCELGGNVDNVSRHSVLESQIHQLRDDLNTHINNYNEHIHPGVLSGSASTAVTTSLSSESEIDISEAKINELKTL